MKHSSCYFHVLMLMTGLLCLTGFHADAQQLLNKKLSLRLQDTPVSSILKKISQNGGFYFSYNSNIIPGDSIASLDVHRKTVRHILDTLLGGKYEYRETGNYIIIHLIQYNGDAYMLNGRILSAAGGMVANASIYERARLVSSLSDSSGSFRLRLHSNSPRALITISKAGYNDTSFTIHSGYDQTVDITLSPIRRILLDSVTVTPYSQIEKTWMGQLFISSKQKIQDINLSSFFVRQPFQYSVVPGIGTHGKLSAQVVNKFSMNILGGYSAGVNGFELGSLFNIDKKDVKYVQIAGLFNTVGGKMNGAQAAGLHNRVLYDVTGVQVAGINNKTTGTLHGVQIAGVTNHVTKNASGIMLAGIANITPQNVNGVQAGGIFNKAFSTTGMQLAGIGNINKTTVDGAQISAVFNYTHNLKGLQIGLVNIADTSSGYSIGLINFIRNGYHKISLSWNEAFDLNMTYKSGNRNLYTMLLASANTGKNRKAFSLGYGIGKEFDLTPALSLAAELTEQSIYTGRWSHLPLLARLQPALQVKLGRKISLFAGPSLSVYFSEAAAPAEGYRSVAPARHYFTLANDVSAWLGGQAGITLF